MTDEAQSPDDPGEKPRPAEGASGDAAAPSTKPAEATTGDKLGTPWKPSYVFLAVVTVLSLAADLGTKWWAKARLVEPGTSIHRSMDVIDGHLAFTFAKNRGGAWGLLQNEPEVVRRWFFLGVSLVAVVFIVSLYRKLLPQQIALKWGLPLVLGGALGNLVNRIQFSYVVDFIDYRADWVRKLNGLFTDEPSNHWPTFNVADIAIVVGVGLMAIDMFTSRRPADGAASSTASVAKSAVAESPVAESPVTESPVVAAPAVESAGVEGAGVEAPVAPTPEKVASADEAPESDAPEKAADKADAPLRGT